MNFIYNYYNGVLIPLRNMLAFGAVGKNEAFVQQYVQQDGSVCEEYQVDNKVVCRFVFGKQFNFYEKTSTSKNIQLPTIRSITQRDL